MSRRWRAGVGEVEDDAVEGLVGEGGVEVRGVDAVEDGGPVLARVLHVGLGVGVLFRELLGGVEAGQDEVVPGSEVRDQPPREREIPVAYNENPVCAAERQGFGLAGVPWRSRGGLGRCLCLAPRFRRSAANSSSFGDSTFDLPCMDLRKTSKWRVRAGGARSPRLEPFLVSPF